MLSFYSCCGRSEVRAAGDSKDNKANLKKADPKSLHEPNRGW